MLPRPLRLTSPVEHRAVMRRGRRAGGGALTVHLLTARTPTPDSPAAGASARAGLVVGKVVGNAVVRHRVSRQIRHLLADRLGALPAGSLVVVRAGASAGTADLARDLDGALGRLERAGAMRQASS